MNQRIQSQYRHYFLLQMKHIISIFIAITFYTFGSFAQTQTQPQTQSPEKKASYGEMNLEDLMNVKVTVASKSEATILSSPGIVSLVTEDEIKRSGARTLVDILQNIPGITFALDTNGTMSISIRGNWASEGKVLVLMDGEILNENLYGTLQLIQRYPADQIKRIEMVRGPGSTIYGGYAELGVIDIQTKGVGDYGTKGIQAFLSSSQTAKTFTQNSLSLGMANEFNDWKFSSFLSTAHGQVSDKPFTDQNGTTFDLTGQSTINPQFINLGAQNGNLSLRFIYDDYNTMDRTMWGSALSDAVLTRFTSSLFGTVYNLKLNDEWAITSEYHYKQDKPWKIIDPIAASIPGGIYNKIATSHTVRVQTKWNPNDLFNFNIGFENVWSKAEDKNEGGVWWNGDNKVGVFRSALFSEINWKTELAYITLGGRYEKQDNVEASAVPRFAAVKEFGNFHTKILLSQGYRTPVFENINRLFPNFATLICWKSPVLANFMSKLLFHRLI